MSPSRRAIAAAVGAALLFGISTPLAKLLLTDTSPLMLAALLYLGAGAGLLVVRLVARRPRVRLPRADAGWFALAVLVGGVLGPALLLWGVSRMPATGASLLLNSEAVLTAVLAWWLFREHVGPRIALGMAAVVAGAVVVSVPEGVQLGSGAAPLAVVGACLCWAVDNNLTRRVSDTDPSWLAMVKGLAAGTTNLVLALVTGSSLPSGGTAVLGLTLGLLSYGVSLVLFVIALRGLGTARAGAYFSTAPFIGALLAVALGESLTWSLAVGGAFMAVGIWLHLTERHAHEHRHDSPGGMIVHAHPHYPDTEHRHGHDAATEP